MIVVLVLSSALIAAPEVKAIPAKPVSYFEASCARCHGQEGSFYGDEMGATKTWSELRHAIDEMAKGPAQAPLKPAELEAQTAYHWALKGKEPFAIWNETGSGFLAGEVTVDTKIKANVGQSELKVTVKEGRWRLTLPSQNKPSEVKLVLLRGKAKVEWSLGRQATSHVRPEKS